jgi:hypothetical protein
MAKKSKKGEKKSSRSMQEEFLVMLEDGLRTAGQVTKREFDRVSDAVRAKMERRYGKERIERMQNRVKANWEETVRKLNSAAERVEADDAFRKAKRFSAEILEDLASAIKRAAENLEASLSDKITYHAGQIVDKGVFLCNNCSKIQEVKRRRKLSPCAECASTEFRSA